MAVSLQKGQKISLTKDNSSLSKLIIGLGWDEDQPQKAGGFMKSLIGSKKQSIDCDATAIMCVNGKLTNQKDIVYFGNLTHDSKAVKHLGDNLTGAGDGDDEQIKVELGSIPSQYDKLIFVVNIYQCAQRAQHFGMIKNAFIRIVDESKNVEICRYSLSSDYDQKTAIIFGEVYKTGNEWKFNAIGEGTTDTGLSELVNRFK